MALKIKLFVDLDGVLVDFDLGVFKATGKYPHEQPQSAMWSKLSRIPGFYAQLPWMEGGRDLWQFLLPWNPTVLTGLPLGTWARPQKITWCARELGPHIPVLTSLSREKAETAATQLSPGEVPVLIDDRDSLRDAWEAKGGIFIHFTSNAQARADFMALEPRLPDSAAS